MNHIYRSIWNQATGAYAAVSENVKSAGKRSLPGASGGGAHFALTSMAAALMLGYGSLALAGPTGGNVVAGQATINGAPGSTVINQGSQNAVINWASFNIGQGESVQFKQPNSNAVALNRVLGSDGTSILGNLSANGKVFIVNPNGILFGQGASVNTAGLVASTLDISNNDFMSGKYQFKGNGTGKVLNQGSISAPGAYVALLGANVSNQGTIQARLGSVALAAGKVITLDVAGDGLLNVAINEGAVGALVNNGGLIRADGGSVLLSAQAAGDLLKTVVNNTGVIEAQTIDTRGGTIKLLGDMQSGTVNAGGTLDASAPTGGNGGFIDTSAAHVKLDDGLKVTTAAAKGLAGTWLIDPSDYNIAASGGDQTGAFFSNALKSSNVQIQSISGSGGTQGNINVNDTIVWSTNKLTLTAQNNININTAMRGSGTASLALEYGQSSAAGTGSTYNVKAEVDLPSGNNFSTRQGSTGAVMIYQVINSLGAANSVTGSDLQGINGALGGNYVLGSNIDARSTSAWSGGGFSPIGRGDAPLGGGNATPFTGKFDGLGHVVSGLTINRANTAVGLFGVIGSSASVSNLGLEGGSVSTSSPNYLGDFASAGMLAGVNQGLVNNVYSTGAVNGSGYTYIGGLVGKNTGSISNSRAGGAVVSAGYYGGGGLVGYNAAGATVTSSSASGTVSSDSTGSVGGLIGFNYGLISRSFATGAVSGGQRAGGLTAYNRYQGTGPSQGIEYSYATGTVTGHTNTGGLVGENDNAKISNSYSTSTVTGTPGNGAAGDIVGGLVGFNQSGGTIANSYATGNVSGNSNIGGVVGWNNQTSGTGGVRSSLTNVYSSGKVTGVSNVGGVAGQNGAPNGIANGIYNTTLNAGAAIGLNTGTATTTGLSSTQMKSASSFTGFNFTSSAGALGNNWVMVNTDGSLNSTTGTGATLPMLASEWSNTITSAHQLQLMGMSLTAQYVLANDIAAATTASSTLDVWNGGSFIPVGASGATPFAGRFDGAGHTIYGLVVNRPLIDYAGLFGATASNAYIANVGLEGGSITGKNYTGALVGSNAGTVNGSFSTVNVTGASQVGGLVGYSSGTVSNNYASGAVSGTDISGGLVGANTGTLTNNYANGVVSGTSNAGGLAGTNSGASSGNFWDSSASGKASSATGTSLSTAQLKTLSLFSAAGWDLGGTWVVYDGNSTPLLRSFMTPLYVNFNGTPSKTYDGTNSWTAPTSTYSTLTDSRLQGTLNYGAAGSAINAGTYAITAGGLYSGQHGYLISNNAATLTIAQRGLTLGGAFVISRAYDGTANASLTGGSLNGLLAQDMGNVKLNTGVFASQNAGNGIVVTALLTGSAGGNYVITTPGSLTGSITPKALTVSGLSVASKQYDGNTGATFTGGSLNGLVGNETLSLANLAGTYADANAGTGKAVAVNPNTLSNGTGLASNYTLATPTGFTGDITARVLTISGMTAANKIYDGTTDAFMFGGVLNNLVSGETLGFSGSTGAFSDKNAGNGKSVTVSGTTLQNGTGLASNYTFTSPGNVTANISKATISSVTNVGVNNKTYDGSDIATLNGAGTFNGMVSGDSLMVAGNGAFGDKNAGAGKTVAVTGLTLSGTDAGNYNLAITKGSTTADITQKALTVTGATAADKTYDGTSTATLSGGSLTGMVSGETLVLNGASGEFSDKNAGNGKVVTFTGGNLGNGSGLASNYTIGSSAAGTANITPKTLTVTGATAVDKTYDGSAAAVLSGGSLNGMVGQETLVLNGVSGAFNDQNAGNGKVVTVTGGNLGNGNGSGLASNYTIGSSAAGTANITPKTLTVTGATAADKTYDGSAAAVLSGGSLNGMVGQETLVLNGVSGAFNDQNAGNGKVVTVTGGNLGNGSGLVSNYTIGSSAAGTANITPKALTVTGVTATNKIYDGLLQAVLSGGSLSGLVGNEALTLDLSGQTGTFASKNVGNNIAIDVTGAVITNGTGLVSNYAFSNASGVTGNITPKALTVTGVTATNKIYDGLLQAVLSGGSLSGLVSGEALNLDLSGQTGAFASKNVGNNIAVNVTGAMVTDSTGLASNYAFSNASGVTANITPKALTVTGVTAANKVYDGSLQAALSGGSLSGLVSGETLTLNLSNQAGAFADKNAGSSKVINVTGATVTDGTGLASNYIFSNASGVTASITPKALTVIGQVAGNKVYDGNTVAQLIGGSLSGLVGDETLGIAGQTAAFSDKNVANAKAVTVSGTTLLDGSGSASNYSVSNPTGLTASITPKAVTVIGQVAGNKVYDGNVVAQLIGGSLSGLVGDETLGIGGQTAAFSDKNAANAKAVTVSGTTLLDAGNGTTAGSASNYSVSNPTGLTASITPKVVTVIGQVAGNKVYDGNTVAQLIGGSLSGLVGSETLAIGGQTAAFSDKNAANAKTVTVSGTTLLDGSGAASNYTVTDPTGLTASITPKALTVVGQVAGNKVYDGNTVAQLTGGSLSGLVGDETLGIGGQTAAFSDKNAANAKTVTVSGTTLLDGSGAASNYSVSNPTGLTASITPKAVTVIGQVAGNKVYDGNTVAQLSGGSLSGLVGDETLAIAGQTAAFSDKNAANAKAVTVSGTTLLDGSGAASNYTVSNPTGLTASITPKAVTVVGQVAGNKVYDGNTVAQLTGGSLSGLVGDETLAIGGQTAAFSDKNAANAKTVTVSGTTLLDGSGAASNYTVSNPTGLTASITPKAVTVIGQVAGNKVYDGNTVAQLIGGSLSGLVGSETLAIGGQTAAFSDKNVANAKTVTVSGTTLLDGSGSASNYSVSNPTGLTASITPKALTVVGQVAGNKVYDGNAVAQLIGGSLSGLVGDETLGIGGQTANFSDKNAANAKTVTVSGTTLLDGSGAASNYSVSNPTGLTASITPKAVTVIGQVAGNKVYDGNTVAQLSGGSLSGLVGSETLVIGGQTASFSDKNAANAKTVTVSGTTLLDGSGSASNYTVTNPTGLTASITPASISGISGIVAANKVYDGSTAASVNLAGASFNGMVAGDALNLTGVSVVGAFSDKNAASGKTVTISGLGLGGADAGNYVLASKQASTTASISQAALTVKVDNAEKDQGRVNPAFSAAYSGLVAGDTLANEVSGNLLFSTPAGTGSPAGNYLVSASGQASNNYALNYVDGVLKVNPTEALQSAIANVIAAVAVAPSQGNMVQADMIVSGDTGPAATGATAEAHADSNAPVVQLSGNVISNVLPGLRLSVVDTGLSLPVDVAGGTRQEGQ